MVLGHVAREVLRYAGTRFPQSVKAFQRYDVRIFKGLYGPSGGRGVRHGRDVGSIIAGTYRGTSTGDIGDAVPYQPGSKASSRKKFQTRDRRGFKRSYKRRYCYPPNRRRY